MVVADITNNYPDILGYVTGGERYNLGVVQLALAVRPRVVRAGRPFEGLLLIQNASDAPMDVVATLRIPEEDAKKQKKRFLTKAERLVVGVQPAEVGYVQLPVSCLADTAVGADYRLGMQIVVKPGANKPGRVRLPEGGGVVQLELLPEAAAARLEDLRKLQFTTQKSGMFRDVLEAPFSVMSGTVGKIADLAPGWVSLWTLADHHDDKLLLARHADTLRGELLPKLKRARLFKPLMQAVQERYKASGYPLKTVEAAYVAKLLTLVLEFANPTDVEHGAHGYLAAGDFSVLQYLAEERLADPRPVTLPAWASKLLRIIDQDLRAAQYPEHAITRFALNELLTDAMLYSFKLLESVLGEDLGKEAEMRAYAEHVLRMLNGSDKLNFTYAYMPLVLGGLAVYDQVIMPQEKIGELLVEMRGALEGRRVEIDSETRPVYEMADRLIDRALLKYGYRE